MKEFTESENMELKTSLAESTKILETVSAFSNTKGGEIFIGVSPEGKIIGVDLGKNTLENLASEIKHNTDPAIFPNIEIVEIQSMQIIKIDIREYPVKPVFSKGKVFVRVGRSNQRATTGKIRNLFKSHSLRNWDSRLTECSFDEISSRLIDIFLQRIANTSEWELDFPHDPKSVLTRFGLAKDGKITNAAVLLFAKDPQKFLISSKTKCAKFSGTEPVDFEDFQDIHGALLQQIPGIMNFIKKHINVGISIGGKPERNELWEIPSEALREAVINAVCHREYESTANVQIRIFDDRIEIWNPGLLPPEISVEQLLEEHPSIPRNELIAQTFYRIRLIENWGTGTNRIIRICNKAGLRAPKFEEKSGSFVVSFYRSRVSTSFSEHLLTETQKAIIKHLLVVGEASTGELAKVLNVNSSTIQRNINKAPYLFTWIGNSKRDPKGKYKLTT